MSLLLKVACPECGHPHESAVLGAELRCARCGRDFRASGHGENASQILSVTPDELDNVPYGQRVIEVPVNSVSSVFVADPALIADKLLRDTPIKENTRWVGKVRLLKKLGQGGMGAVYRGYDESLALDVAVKILPLPMGERDNQFVARFRQEARISAQINHPNVVRTLHVDEQGDLIFLVMDFIEGQTARQLVESRGPLALPLALQIIHDATKGVQAAHQHNVIHRDIKPDNILVADDGRVLLTDLGLAKTISTAGPASRMPVTRLGLLLGTPHYMSPEQWNIGALCGPAADIWSIGATLWMLLTRMPPFDDKDTGVLAKMIKEAPLPDIRSIRKEIPDCVVDILNICMAKRPESRFADCGELLKALDWALNDLSAQNGNGCLPKPLPGSAAKSSGTNKAVVVPPESAAAVMAPLPSFPIPNPPPAPPARVPAWAQVPVAPPVLRPKKNKARQIVVLAAPVVFIAGLILLWPSGSSKPKETPIPVVDLHCSARVKPGEAAELSAVLNGVNPTQFTCIWSTRDSAYPGSTVHVPIENDTEFTLTVRDKSTTHDVVHRIVRVEADVAAKAAEIDYVKVESGTTQKFEGHARGGAGSKDLETRWIDADHPEAVLALGSTLSLGEDAVTPGKRVVIFQARRKTDSDWNSAASDRLTLDVSQRVPPEFKALMLEVAALQENATKAQTGIEAVAAWRAALAAIAKARKVFPSGDTEAQERACQQGVSQNEKYLELLSEARRSKSEAEQLPASDGVGRLSAWSESCRPYTAALALFDRAEVRSEATAAQNKVEHLKKELITAEQTRAEFDASIAKARHSANEGKKYLSPAVALPHWEAALEGFETLARKFPTRADDFALELKEVQENRDRAYLQVNFGIVPAAPKERKQELNPTPPIQANQRKIPEPSSGVESKNK
jgi:serine/threonine-protein kinase